MAVLVVALVGGSAWGFVYAGPLGGLLGVLGGTAIGAVTFTLLRMRSSVGRLDERPAPDVRELPPEQAVQVLTALLNAGASEGRSLEIGGGLLAEIASARARADAGDLEGALAKLRGLAEQHPRAPAVPAEIARLLAAQTERATERRRAASRAIELAIHGGMFRMAAQLFAELDAEERAAIELPRSGWEQLGKFLAAHGDGALAASCRARVELPSRE
jgi:hypothetical protein